MLEYRKGNLLESGAEALVNTVNCVGVMGKGIAFQFKNAFPDNFKAYKKACDSKLVKTGKMFVFSTDTIHTILLRAFGKFIKKIPACKYSHVFLSI